MTQLLVHHHSFLRSRLIDRQLIKTHVVTTCVSWTRSTSTCEATVVTQKKVDFLFHLGHQFLFQELVPQVEESKYWGVLFKSKGREELVTDIDSDANVVPV